MSLIRWFAKKSIRFAPVVCKVSEEGRNRFGVYLDSDQVSLIKVAVDPKEFFAEAVRKAVLRRLETVSAFSFLVEALAG